MTGQRWRSAAEGQAARCGTGASGGGGGGGKVGGLLWRGTPPRPATGLDGRPTSEEDEEAIVR
jgi:hypothetical protein